jgi:hypothetical protein
LTAKPHALVCPWCHQRPEYFSLPTQSIDPGAPAMCPKCGRWSIMAEDSSGYVRANTAMRNIIRDLPEAQKIREKWRQKVLRGREAG